MSYKVFIDESLKKDLEKLKRSNPTAFKKFQCILPELAEHPRTGSGHPEPLVGGNNVEFSRRLTKKDRLVYKIFDDVVVVLVVSVVGHYGDK